MGDRVAGYWTAAAGGHLVIQRCGTGSVASWQAFSRNAVAGANPQTSTKLPRPPRRHFLILRSPGGLIAMVADR
jgi:hypothetical protein